MNKLVQKLQRKSMRNSNHKKNSYAGKENKMIYKNQKKYFALKLHGYKGHRKCKYEQYIKTEQKQ